ncbi:MAG: hypothetical protein KOO62_00130 [candidate division Zixibacteria bacterium]|nr:hypothetical protein [candidate division Zixibacteria bacterium]
MKRILIAAVLLVVLISIAYLKTNRQYDQSQDAYDEGRIVGMKGLDQKRQEADSLRYKAIQQEIAFADSMLALSRDHRQETDSLIDRISFLKSEMASLQSKLQDARNSTRDSQSMAKKSEPKKPSRHTQILTAYKKRYRALPSDLSTYEKRVALGEIRQETADEFKITLAELSKIRTAGKLNY